VPNRPSNIRRLLGAIARAPGRAVNGVDRFCILLGTWGLRRLKPLGVLYETRVQPLIGRYAPLGRDKVRTGVLVAGRPVVRAVRFLPWSVIFWALCIVVVGLSLALWHYGQGGLRYVMGLTDVQVDALKGRPEWALLTALPTLGGILAAVAFLAAVLSFTRSRVSLWMLKIAASGYAVVSGLALFTAWQAPAVLNSMDSEFFPAVARDEVWVRGTLILVWPILFAALFLLLLVLRSTVNYYTKQSGMGEELGDRIVTNFRTHGRDPGFRKSIYGATVVHLIAILLPLLVLRGCMAPYGVPKGSGQPVLQVIKIEKLKKEEKRYVINLEAAISFYVPKIDESKVFEEVDKMTEDTYEAQQLGKLGAGNGTKGGWPDGMEDAKVRFIRLEYDGGDWDQDMGYDADYNMLLVFHELTGFNIWPKTESIHITDLKRFPKNRAPPFVYLTGGLKGRVNVSQSEIKALRDYCLKMGGMVFADNGGGNFDRSFRAVMGRTFPELPIVEISYDDVIFKQPFYFPRGAPPLWHHSGQSAMGVKYKGRWIVFYHQGDINDAWKEGHSGASPGIAAQAYKLGVNVMAYAFNQYMQINFGGEVPK